MPTKLIRVPQQLAQRIKSLAKRMKTSEAEVYRRAAANLVQQNQSVPSILDDDFKPIPFNRTPSLDPDEDLYRKPVRGRPVRRRKARS
jgi:hypothetical protein